MMKKFMACSFALGLMMVSTSAFAEKPANAGHGTGRALSVANEKALGKLGQGGGKGQGLTKGIGIQKKAPAPAPEPIVEPAPEPAL
jgi:hypothetical protein